jgi:hypothetical protein
MRKFLITSPTTGELLAITADEAGRLLGRPEGHDVEAELRAAEAIAATTGRDTPLRSHDRSEEWMVAAPPRRGL